MSIISNGAIEKMRKTAALGGSDFNIQVLKIICNNQETNKTVKQSDLKFKLIVTDGVDYCTAVINSSFNVDIQKDNIRPFTVIQVTHSAPVASSKTFAIIGLKVIKHLNYQDCDLDIVSEDGYTSTRKNKRLNDNSGVSCSTTATSNKIAKINVKDNGEKQKKISKFQADLQAERDMIGMKLSLSPIAALSFCSRGWYVTARVVKKTDVVTWKHRNGDGTLFSIVLLDADSGQIKATFYNEACSKFFDRVVKGKIYMFANGSVKSAERKKYRTVNNNYEISFPVNTIIVPLYNNKSIKLEQYNFIKIDRIVDCIPDSYIDVIGVVRAVSELTAIKVKSTDVDRTGIKRDLTIVDDSGSEIKVSLWEDMAQDKSYEWDRHPIVAFQGVFVKHFNGCSLSASHNTLIVLNPDVEEAFGLAQYRDRFAGGIVPPATSLTTLGGAFGILDESKLEDRQTIDVLHSPDIELSVVCAAPKGLFFTIRATVTVIRQNGEYCYTACATPNCNKKVEKNAKTGKYRCEKCNQNLDECKMSLVLFARLADHTGSQEMSFHNAMGELLLGGTSVSNLIDLKKNNLRSYQDIFDAALFQTWICKVKVTTYDGKSSCTVIAMAKEKTEWEYAQAEKFVMSEMRNELVRI